LGKAYTYLRTMTDKLPVRVLVCCAFDDIDGAAKGEFYLWFQRYFDNNQTRSLAVQGAENPVLVRDDGVAGAVLGMGKTRAAMSLQAILLDCRLDFSRAYFLLMGCAGSPPSQATVGDVFWATHIIDYDLGHRWAERDGDGKHCFSPRKRYEEVRRFQLNPELTQRALEICSRVALTDCKGLQSYRVRYPDVAARRSPRISTGTFVSGDTFFHGPRLSQEAQFMCDLYEVDNYVVTEMEGSSCAYVLLKFGYLDRLMSVRVAVNFDQGCPSETTLDHLDPKPGHSPGGFDTGIYNCFLAGSVVLDDLLANPSWSLVKTKSLVARI